MKSNINIASNVYLRTDKEIKYDNKYVQAISGHSALVKVNKDHLHLRNPTAKLSKVQEKELSETPTCSKAKDRQHTHGKVLKDGVLTWVGRCEYTLCDGFQTCQETYTIERTTKTLVESECIEENVAEFEYLGVPLFNNSTSESLEKVSEEFELSQEDITDEIRDEPIRNFNEKFKRISSPSEIISHSIDSTILVNAGPGTGKTYSVINRLLYIIKNELADPENILVLCYSRAAVVVIRKRIEEGVNSGELPIEANLLGIYTFDWFATKYLTFLEENVDNLTYDERIDLFNRRVDKEFFSSEYFKYLIIDELQDVVNVRAQMVLNILNSIECGYLLLGDRCQAIYDFDTTGEQSINSTKFYDLLDKFLPTKTKFYELTKNNRQSEKLSEFTQDIREILLSDDCVRQNEYVKLATEKIESLSEKAEKIDTIQFDETKKSAILCRKNGEALMIGNYLNKAKIPHLLLCGNSVSPKLKRFVADVFWDYTESHMTITEFCNRYLFRVKDDKDEARVYFRELSSIVSEHETDVLSINELKAALQLESNITETLTNGKDENLIVSTIHRAKGQEFDNVYLLNTPLRATVASAEEARIRYVAFTRAKKVLKTLERKKTSFWCFGKDKGLNRSYRIMFKGKWYFCSGISICDDSHIDKTSFVSTIIHDDVLGIQEYISENVQKFDEVEARYSKKSNVYEVYHKNVKIGILSKDSVTEFWKIINSTSVKIKIPNKLVELYVSDVYSIIGKSHNDDFSPLHKKTNIWLGVNIMGMGKADYYN